jgi:hypothetical protein
MAIRPRFSRSVTLVRLQAMLEKLFMPPFNTHGGGGGWGRVHHSHQQHHSAVSCAIFCRRSALQLVFSTFPLFQGGYSAEAAAITGARVTYHRKRTTDPGAAFFKPGQHWE